MYTAVFSLYVMFQMLQDDFGVVWSNQCKILLERDS